MLAKDGVHPKLYVHGYADEIRLAPCGCRTQVREGARVSDKQFDALPNSSQSILYIDSGGVIVCHVRIEAERP